MIGQLKRFFHITRVVLHFRLDELIWRHAIPEGTLRRLGMRTLNANRIGVNVRVRLTCETLGPVFIKLGQMLSTRPDLLPPAYIEELARLQDRVPPFPDAAKIVEKSIGQPLESCFARFETEPLASASIAQVHGALMPDGRSVVVKVLRPNLESILQRDMALLGTIARWLNWIPAARRLRGPDVVREYKRIIFDELNLLREGANAMQMRRNSQRKALLYIPEIIWPLTRRNVLVLERIHGIRVNDFTALDRAGVDRQLLAQRGVEIFFSQVFEDNFFHADMHPGNIFVDASAPDDPRYIAIDFGIVGHLTARDQNHIAQSIMAVLSRDYERVAQIYITAGWGPTTIKVEELEGEIRSICEPIFDRALGDISFGQILLRLFETVRRFDMEVQPQLVLLQKTLLHIEGLGRQIYPKLDLWRLGKPFMELWLKEQIGPISVMKKAGKNWPMWAELIPELPVLLRNQLDGKPRHLSDLRDRGSSQLHNPGLSSIKRVALTLIGLFIMISLSVSDMKTFSWELNWNVFFIGVGSGMFLAILWF